MVDDDLYVGRYTYTAMLEVQHMIDTTWIMSPRPVVPWGLRKALNWVRDQESELLFLLLLNKLDTLSTTKTGFDPDQTIVQLHVYFKVLLHSKYVSLHLFISTSSISQIRNILCQLLQLL